MCTSVRETVFTYETVELDVTTHANQGRGVTITLILLYSAFFYD
jgi:hypothetical protein